MRAANPHDGTFEEDMLSSEWARGPLSKLPIFGSMITGREYTLNIFQDAEAIPANMILQSSSCFLGMTRIGKTNGLAVELEELAKLRASFSVIDSEGDLYTISELYPWVHSIKVSMKWPADKIKKLANWVVLNRGALIIRFEQSSSMEFKRFFELTFLGQLLEVCDQLFEKGKHVPHLHVIDEAHRFIPQMGRSAEKHQIDLIELIGTVATTGQKRGLGIMAATTRPASLNPQFLSQVKVRNLMRVIEETDLLRYRTSLMQLEDAKNKVGKIMREVISLGVGQVMFVPEHGRPIKAKFRLRESRHISKTPGIEDYARLDTVDKSAWPTEVPEKLMSEVK